MSHPQPVSDSPRDLFREGSRALAAYEAKGAAYEAGDLVRRWRETAVPANLTQAQLAGLLGVSQARISALESARGAEGPSYATLKRIALACGHGWPHAMLMARDADGAQAPAHENPWTPGETRRDVLMRGAGEGVVAIAEDPGETFQIPAASPRRTHDTS